MPKNNQNNQDNTKPTDDKDWESFVKKLQDYTPPKQQNTLKSTTHEFKYVHRQSDTLHNDAKHLNIKQSVSTPKQIWDPMPIVQAKYNIIIYSPTSTHPELKGQNLTVRDKIMRLAKECDLGIIKPKGLTAYQKERAFIYGDHAYGHATAVICITGEEPIPFGVISPDINNKKLPVIVYVENNDKARKVYADFYKFLEETNTQINKHLKNVDSFHFKNSNHVTLYAEEKDEINKSKFLEAIQKIRAIYYKHPDEKRSVRMESNPPTKAQLDEKRSLFSKKEGFSHVTSSLEEFKSHLDKDRPTISFFGMIFSPLTDKCQWATELGHCNLIYGLGGADKNKPLKDQSVMYQFAHYAKVGGCKIYGAIPFGQVSWEEKRDFSLGIESVYITPQLQERMDAFKDLSHFIIVGSTGTGTYEEIIDTLRTNPLTHIMIINDDGGNEPLVKLLRENINKYPNITVVNNRSEFKLAIDTFKFNFERLNFKDKTPDIKSQKKSEQEPVSNSAKSYGFYKKQTEDNTQPEKSTYCGFKSGFLHGKRF